MPLVSKDFNFTGKHAIMAEELKQSGLFEYLWQIFVTAPIVGFIYKRKADNDPGENKTIFLSQLSPRQQDIYFIYKLYLLNKNETISRLSSINTIILNSLYRILSL